MVLQPVVFIFSSRNVLAVTVGLWESWIRIGWVKIPLTSFLKWSWLIHSIRPSGGTPTPNGSPSPSTSTERCVGWRQPGARVVGLARATNSTTPSVAHAVRPGEGATPCSCTATANSCKRGHLIKIMQVVQFNSASAASWVMWISNTIFQESRCSPLLTGFWKCNLVLVKIVGPERRVLWWASLLVTWKDVCNVYWKPKHWSVFFFLLVWVYLVTICRLESLVVLCLDRWPALILCNEM